MEYRLYHGKMPWIKIQLLPSVLQRWLWAARLLLKSYPLPVFPRLTAVVCGSSASFSSSVPLKMQLLLQSKAGTVWSAEIQQFGPPSACEQPGIKFPQVKQTGRFTAVSSISGALLLGRQFILAF